MAYSLPNIRVRRVLECLRDHSRKSLEEVTEEYNRRYPPSLIRRVIGVKVDSKNILRILTFLIQQKLVTTELDHATDQTPEILFFLTQEGIRRPGLKR